MLLSLMGNAVRGSRALVLVVAAIACSGEPVRPDAGDAGGDGGAVDGGLDAATRDARETGMADAPDAPDGDDAAMRDPGWVRIPGNPDNCYIEYASHPENFCTVRTLPCPSVVAIPGCTAAYMVPPWHTGLDARGSRWDPAAHRGLFHAAANTATGTMLTDALLSTDGTSLVVVRAIENDFPNIVCPTDLATWTNTASVSADYFAPAPPPRPFHLFRGPFAELFSDPLPVGDLALLPRGTNPQYFLTSATVTVNQIVPRGYLLISRGGAPTNHTHPGGATPYAVVGDDVFWAIDGAVANTTQIWHSGADDTDNLLIDGATTGDAFDYFTTDGTTMVWTAVVLGADHRTVVGFTLMTSPHATTAAGVVATRVPGTLPDTATPPRVGAGVVAYGSLGPAPVRQHQLDVVRLSDGAHSRVVLPTNPRWYFTDMPAWVTDDEVAIPGGPNRGPTVMFRIPRSAFVPVP